jgi:hypothetical protein
MRERDLGAAKALRTALSILANAEAVPVTPAPRGLAAEHVAGAAQGLAATEADRTTLSESQAHGLVAAEVVELTTHSQQLAAMGRVSEAETAQQCADLLQSILDSNPPR